nr:immunoglobulin light chain junction region [Macaca mulatta]MOY05307.1 immunoglobulin light chain junction region [Macaca mulatta]MOY05373.1 immunoglobulin light chain junction region [Macaca mulatta]MOY05382.1 immunoglobulin light chain junction region [Macaca mulatta]MOY05797.1 immunoglobulin light chain junction region [Macaca mulatta]
DYYCAASYGTGSSWQCIF